MIAILKRRAEGILYIRDRMDFHGSIFLWCLIYIL